MEHQEQSKSTEATNQASEQSDTANNSEQTSVTQGVDQTVNSEEKTKSFSHTETQNDVQDDVKNTAGSSAISESSQADENLHRHLEADVNQQQKALEADVQTRDKFTERMDKKNVGWFLGMRRSTNDTIYNGLVSLYNFLADNYKRSPSDHVGCHIQNAKKALDLINRLESDQEKFRRELERQDKIQRTVQAENNNLLQEQQRLQGECKQANQKVQILEQEKKDQEARISGLLTKLAELQQNTGTHYNATSDRPHHHILTGEYKTLKEQHLDPLANRLFNVMLTSKPELKQQRKEKTNDIKAIISATVLINGQAIMRGESIGSAQLPPEILNEMQSLLRQKLQLDDISPDTTELLTKAVNSARGKVEYPQPGNWQEKDYVKAGEELINSLDTELDTSLTPELKTEAQEAIKNALQFLERAALAEPPAKFSLEKEGVPFRSDYHEAAKGWDDEGTVIKTIYPVYLVNGEAKVKAVVLTELSTENNSESSSLMTV